MNLRVTAIFFLAALTSSCGVDDELSERIERLAATNVGRSVSLVTVTPFVWDEIARFGPYFPKPKACEILNLSAWGCFWLPFPKPDDSAPSMVVFLNEGEVVRFAFLAQCKVRITLRSGSVAKTGKGSGQFLASQEIYTCSPGVHLLAQE